ncbi:MAG: hypothetical protein HQK96_11145 [Nitrospirae bacterium]|nr:hypothetical protein [Nitrospirota bacterium]
MRMFLFNLEKNYGRCDDDHKTVEVLSENVEEGILAEGNVESDHTELVDDCNLYANGDKQTGNDDTNLSEAHSSDAISEFQNVTRRRTYMTSAANVAYDFTIEFKKRQKRLEQLIDAEYSDYLKVVSAIVKSKDGLSYLTTQEISRGINRLAAKHLNSFKELHRLKRELDKNGEKQLIEVIDILEGFNFKSIN